jgi:hypothetical protein
VTITSESRLFACAMMPFGMLKYGATLSENGKVYAHLHILIVTVCNQS